MESRPLEPIFTPKSVAIVGASGREGSVGRALLYNTLINGFTGVVYPINARAKSVLGVKAYPSVLDVPDDVDLAVLVVPAVTVPAILAECGQKKVKGVVMTNDAELIARARKAKLNVIRLREGCRLEMVRD